MSARVVDLVDHDEYINLIEFWKNTPCCICDNYQFGWCEAGGQCKFVELHNLLGGNRDNK